MGRAGPLAGAALALLAGCVATALARDAGRAAPSDKAAAKPSATEARMNVGLVWDERYLAHEAPDHCEKPERLRAIRRALEKAHLWDRLVHITPAPADEATLLRVHSPEHVAAVRKSAQADGLTWLNGDTYACKASYETALLAAGGVCAAVDAVMKGDARSAFCAVRPPGHHATRDRAMGFCLFNNVAIGVRHVQAVHKVRRVFILDIDVHHGNGTQEIFYRDPDILYISLHQWPLYPHSGKPDERGEGPGLGSTHNYPLAPGSGDKAFLAAVDQGLKQAEAFRPEFIFLSAGFDGHKDDPLGGLALTEQGYAEATRRLRTLADRTANGRIVSVLEGGYDLRALGRCVVAHIEALARP